MRLGRRAEGFGSGHGLVNFGKDLGLGRENSSFGGVGFTI